MPRSHRLRRSRRPLQAAALATAAALLLSACGSGSDDGTVRLTFWDNNAGPDRTPLWEHIIAEFEQANPGIEVEYVGIPSAQVQQKYDTAIAGEALPDVGGVSTAYLSNLSGREALVALDDRLAESDLADRLNSGFVENVRAAAADGNLYALPTSANIGIIWYRPDWFAEAGVEEPETWEEFFTAAEELTDPAENRYGFTIRGGAGSIPQVLEEIYAISGITSFFREDGTTTVNDPANVEALERIAAMYDEQTPSADINNDYPKMVAQFTGGDVAMLHHNLGSYANHVEALGEEGVVGTPLWPSEETGRHTIVSNPTDGVGVFRSSEHQEEAWRFVEFVASSEMNSYWNEQVGQIPANLDVQNEEWVNANQALARASEIMNDDATVLVQLPYYLPQFNSIVKTDLEPLYQQVLLGEMSAQEFLDTAARQLDEAEAEYRERHGA
ncbi:ABC transporter substrate-binding protein [Marinactinospora thermotolerans]|uniref:Carbohydrate ABC transporter substrate-binding protein, CUT1 family (TC 3.A.1.1.-) n=1 Tax=Marinactinospora thermotolerans DSM 45154 TaxID=1122192 RepID=A0A1T4JYK5_9ACTN|nr:sugar ABC transporter substrate-binding protein [Marinactinospora thermotolerans]SJZ35261.1 carbohydrate ABC transporter substrate-binding protein, CUT1 family (TC 3.A.1.1.-) [Marinactinospora thermotolerans DSM 45154]